MKFAKILWLSLFLLAAVTPAAFAEAIPSWQKIPYESASPCYLDGNTVKNVGSADIIYADLKKMLSPAEAQKLTADDPQIFTSEITGKIAYLTCSVTYNQKTKTETIRNQKYFSADNTLLTSRADIEKAPVQENSPTAKLYAAIFQWLYEN